MAHHDDNVSRCTGPNKACRAAHRAGRSVHIIPAYRPEEETLVLPTYHYHTEEQARRALEVARATAPTITTDEELYAARDAGIAHRLPKGWIDPSRRM